MSWPVLATPEFREWFSALDTDQAAAVLAVLEQLQTHGPTLGRPHADHVKGADRHFTMKELRPRAPSFRAGVNRWCQSGLVWFSMYCFRTERGGLWR